MHSTDFSSPELYARAACTFQSLDVAVVNRRLRSEPVRECNGDVTPTIAHQLVPSAFMASWTLAKRALFMLTKFRKSLSAT